MDELEIAKAVGPYANTFIKPIFEATLQPYLEKFKEWLRNRDLDQQKFDNYFENRFSDYIERTLDFCSLANTLVFPNRRIKLLQGSLQDIDE